MADAVALTPEQKAALQAFAAKYPDFDYAALSNPQSMGRGVQALANNPNGRQQLIDFQQLQQVLAPAMKGSHFTPSGDIQKNMAWWKQALLGAAVVAAPGLAYAALPSAAAAGGSAAGAPAVGAGASTATDFGAGTGFQAAGGVKLAATGGGSVLHSLLPSIIGAGAQLGGTALAAHANTEAAKLQAEQADKALALQKEQYALQRQDTAPYRALGQGAVGNLGFLSGIDTQSAVPALSSTVPNQPYGTSGTSGTKPTLSTLSQPAPSAASPMVQVKSPSGQIGSIPAALLPQALAAGGQQVT